MPGYSDPLQGSHADPIWSYLDLVCTLRTEWPFKEFMVRIPYWDYTILEGTYGKYAAIYQIGITMGCGI